METQEQAHSAIIAALSRHLSKNDIDYGDATFHRNVYSYVKNKVIPVVPSSACPPLPVIVYAIRNILEPSLLLPLIPHLLQLLVHLEILRTDAVSKMREMLRRDSKRSSRGSLLTQDEREAVEALVKPSRLVAQRTIFRKVVHGCCVLHIHHLWRTYDAEKDPPLTTYLIDYFPAFFERDPDIRAQCVKALEDCPWHYNLTEEELEENRHVGAQAAEFMLGAAQYVEDPKQYCMNHGHHVDASFDDIFPPPDKDSISAAIMRFIEMVQLAYDTLQPMLDETS
ncbi:hypothetical protein BD414DRAFT_498897 [Trametes punicea]|nr:hypothetical protein BD414DRAFT_498897 [Trametes punicea]